MAAGLVLDVYAEKSRVRQLVFIHNRTPWLMCTFENLHGMHLVVFQFFNKRLNDYFSTNEQLQTFWLAAFEESL